MTRQGSPRILVIRRDNIGDLICTTPLLHGLRTALPEAWLGILVNSYNAPVLAGNPHIDEVFTYAKRKHRPAGTSVAALYWARLKLIRRLRAMRLDYAILAAPAFQASALRFAQLIRPRHVVGYADPQGHIDMPLHAPQGPLCHQVESVYALGRHFGVPVTPPGLTVRADEVLARQLTAALPPREGRVVVGVHLSAREPDRRWPVEHFATLCRELIDQRGCLVLLTWAPGGRDNPYFPGDDEAAAALAASVDRPGLVTCPTADLPALTAAISLCDLQISSDGGPVHLAAGLGKPVICFFGGESPEKWHPWGVPYALLRKPSQQVADIGVEEVLAEFDKLRVSCKLP